MSLNDSQLDDSQIESFNYLAMVPIDELKLLIERLRREEEKEKRRLDEDMKILSEIKYFHKLCTAKYVCDNEIEKELERFRKIVRKHPKTNFVQIYETKIGENDSRYRCCVVNIYPASKLICDKTKLTKIENVVKKVLAKSEIECKEWMLNEPNLRSYHAETINEVLSEQ